MKTYRGAKIGQEVIAEYTDNYYAQCKTCLKLRDGTIHKAKMEMHGPEHVWNLTLLPEANYPMLYANY